MKPSLPRLVCLRPLIALLACACPMSAGDLFEEDFETPEVSGYEQGVTPPDRWVRAANGYGSGDHGMVDKDSGDFSAPDPNMQAYAMSYTNSGITTAEGVLGPTLAAGGAYEVSFGVVKNGATAGRGYSVRLIAFADGALRNDCRNTPANSTVLASTTGSAPDDGSFATVTFTYHTSGTTDLGKATIGDGPFTFARKPTGTYLAPGTIATVTVPAFMVNTGYRVRVGCHSSDFKAKPDIKRLDRVSRTYDITALQTKVAKFVDIVHLYGWEKLDAFWLDMMEDTEDNIAYSTSVDALLLRLCMAVGKDIRPLFHFWGSHPENPAALAASIAAENLPPDLTIRNRLLHYKSLVPTNNAAYRTFATGWWGKQPSIGGNWEEREHARQWDATPLYGPGDQQRSEATNNSVRKLVLSGNNTFNGAFANNTGTSNAATLTKNGAGSWILTGANAYTGATTVSAGKLFINGNQSTASGTVSVAAAATLGGTGTIGGSTTIAIDGKLEFDLGTGPASHDKLELAAAKVLTFSATSVLTITSGGCRRFLGQVVCAAARTTADTVRRFSSRCCSGHAREIHFVKFPVFRGWNFGSRVQ